MKYRHITSQTIEVDGFVLEDVVIAGKTYRLDVATIRNCLYLTFLDKDTNVDFEIVIGDRGCTFNRRVSRPHHDHDDYEKLIIKDTRPVWDSSAGSSLLFRLPFGAEEVSY